MFSSFALPAWEITPLLIVLAVLLLLRGGLAACRDSLQAVWRDVLRIAFASRHSAFGLHPQQSGARLHHLAALAFPVVLWGRPIWA